MHSLVSLYFRSHSRKCCDRSNMYYWLERLRAVLVSMRQLMLQVAVLAVVLRAADVADVDASVGGRAIVGAGLLPVPG